MPGHPRPRLFADARGVWRENSPGHPSGIEWNEIESVGGYKLDGITEVYTVVELDFVYGEFVELNDDWEGFSQVVEAITHNLPEIGLDWFEKISELKIDDPPVTVWSRTNS